MSLLREELSQDLTSAAMDQSINYPYDVEIVQILVHASTNITETVTISFDSGTGSNYDTVLGTKSMSSEDDYVYRPLGQPIIPRADQLRIQITNANTTGTVYVTVLTEARP